MKTRFLAICAIVALSASGSFAGDLTSGGGYYAPPASSSPYGSAGIFGDVNLTAIYLGGDIDDDFGIDLGGAVVAPFGNGWNAAVDGDVGYFFNADEWVAGVNGHLFYANQAWAAGAFVYADTEDTYGIGAEAAAFINNVDVIGDLGYFASTPDFWAASAATNVYFDPDTALSLGLGGAWFDGGGDAWMANAGIEHRFNSSPVSAYADLGWIGSGSADNVEAIAGARVVFGDAGTTLQDYNRANPF